MECKTCGSNKITKFGIVRLVDGNRQRFRCRECGVTFYDENDTTKSGRIAGADGKIAGASGKMVGISNKTISKDDAARLRVALAIGEAQEQAMRKFPRRFRKLWAVVKAVAIAIIVVSAVFGVASMMQSNGYRLTMSIFFLVVGVTILIVESKK